jgi:DNA-binding GntR family transcriptional regulator
MQDSSAQQSESQAEGVGQKDEVYLLIRERVLNLAGQIDEPVRLIEEDMAQELGVSRTPIREALKRLGQEGLLTMQPRRGAVLMPVTSQEYCDWLKLRAELEGFAASEAALNATKHDVDHLRNLFSGFNHDNLASRATDYATANVQFHASLIRLANNKLLERVWASFGHGQMLRFKTIERLNRAHDSLREHAEIIDAIDQRDADRARQLAKDHALGLLQQFLNSPPPKP